MHRALTKILVSMALAMGLSFAGVGAANAAPAAAAPVAARAADCTAQEAALASAQSDAAFAQKQAVKAKKAVKKAKKAVKKAKKAATKKKAKKKLKKARAKFANAKARRDAANNAVAVRQNELAACRAGGGNPPAPTPSASPIQVLCDNGVPQNVCDALIGLIPSGSPTSSFAALCEQVPQAAQLCALLESGPAIDPTTLIDLVDTLLDTLNLGATLLDPIVDLLGLNTLLSPNQLTSLLGQLGLTELVP